MRFPAAGKYHAQVTEVTLSNHDNEGAILKRTFYQSYNL